MVNPRARGGDVPRSQSWPPNGDRLFLPIHAGYRYLSSLAQTEHLPFIRGRPFVVIFHAMDADIFHAP